MSDITRTILDGVKVEDDGTITSKCELMADDVKDEIECFQDYGFASVPKTGAEGVTISIEGASDHYITIATEDHRYRLKSMKNGEVAIYTDEGDSVHLKRGNEIEITTKKCVINAPNVEVSGTLKANAVEDKDGSLGDVRDTYNIHVHGGVTSGTASTSKPSKTV